MADPKSCLGKADPEEPVFVLRAHDPVAASTIRTWVEQRVQRTGWRNEYDDALAVADAMDAWRLTHA